MQQKEKTKGNRENWIDLLHRFIFPFIYLIMFSISLSISYYTYVKMNSNAPEYSIIGKDGTILLNKGFSQYGLFVEKKSLPIIDGVKDDNVATYLLKFNKVPNFFEITTQAGAIPKIKQIDINKYEVQFTFSGYGTERGVEINECNFKVQAY